MPTQRYRITHRGSADDIPSYIECDALTVTEGGAAIFSIRMDGYPDLQTGVVLSPQIYLVIQRLNDKDPA